MNNKIVLDTGALHELKSDEISFKLMSDAGFKYYDYSLYWKGVTEHIGTNEDFRDKAYQVKVLADKYGLSCVQTHGYFTFGIDEESIQRRINYIQKDIEITSILGSKIMVLHPIVEWSKEQNVKWIKENFLPLAHKFDILIAIENVFWLKDDGYYKTVTSTPLEFKELIDSFNDDHIVACVDIGHAEVNNLHTSAVDIIKTLGSRIKCLHIHDNDKLHDNHQMPYTQQINFSKILDALKEIKYDGNITFEVETCYSRGEDPSKCLPPELYPAFIKLQHEIGKYFYNYLNK